MRTLIKSGRTCPVDFGAKTMGDEFDSQKTKALGPGSVVVMPPKMNHFVWTKEETVIQLNITGPYGINYVNPADDPRKK
jgi:hypothetical protein